MERSSMGVTFPNESPKYRECYRIEVHYLFGLRWPAYGNYTRRAPKDCAAEVLRFARDIGTQNSNRDGARKRRTSSALIARRDLPHPPPNIVAFGPERTTHGCF